MFGLLLEIPLELYLWPTFVGLQRVTLPKTDHASRYSLRMYVLMYCFFLFFFFNWNSPHAKLNSHYEPLFCLVLNAHVLPIYPNSVLGPESTLDPLKGVSQKRLFRHNLLYYAVSR